MGYPQAVDAFLLCPALIYEFNFEQCPCMVYRLPRGLWAADAFLPCPALISEFNFEQCPWSMVGYLGGLWAADAYLPVLAYYVRPH